MTINGPTNLTSVKVSALAKEFGIS
jgi:hypothetical protein